MGMLFKPLVPYRIIATHQGEYNLKDLYKAAPGGRELDVLTYNTGLGRWELMPSLVACEKLADHCASTVLDLLQARGIETVPKWIRQGAAMRAAAAGVVWAFAAARFGVHDSCTFAPLHCLHFSRCLHACWWIVLRVQRRTDSAHKNCCWLRCGANSMTKTITCLSTTRAPLASWSLARVRCSTVTHGNSHAWTQAF